MSDKKENPKEWIQGGVQEPRIPIHIPLAIMRWVAYSVLFTVILMPALWNYDVWLTISPALILGHFASQLNALINKK